MESYTDTPVAGSATADTSARALPEHWVAEVCHEGLAFRVEQPLPAPLQALSVQPRELEAFDNEVPTRHHVHTVVRTPNGGDYGTDLLRLHHEQFDHGQGEHAARR